jgi:catechol 2,3-dioxygenase-like lactoylglutathione lyase family enzyme
MCEKTTLQHVALQYTDSKKADIFFTKILGLTLEKEFCLSEDLSDRIFGIKENVDIKIYGDKQIKFEIFFSQKPKNIGFEHICIEIQDKERFIERCNKYDIKPIFVKKGEKILLFIKDYADNLFEIKER